LLATIGLLVYVNDIITIDKDIYDISEDVNGDLSAAAGAQETSDASGNNDSNLIGDSDSHLIWFMQVSDLHISIHHDRTRITDFDLFCKRVLALIQPSVVLATGDLTDSKSGDMLGSRQYEKEWKAYRDLIKDNNLLDKMTWLDVRGNHG
jgi:hypothetical protein